MALKDLQKILKQVHSPNEYSMIPHDLEHPKYWIWKVENGKLSDLNLNLMKLRNEHARFDIFINGQYILEKDYIFEQKGKDLLVKFKKSNFPYVISSTDNIKLEGDVVST
jgi:hypothetical protein